MDAFMDIEPLFGPMSPVLDPEDMAPLSDSEDPPEMHPLMYDSVPRLLSPIPSPPRDASPLPKKRDASPLPKKRARPLETLPKKRDAPVKKRARPLETLPKKRDASPLPKKRDASPLPKKRARLLETLPKKRDASPLPKKRDAPEKKRARPLETLPKKRDAPEKKRLSSREKSSRSPIVPTSPTSPIVPKSPTSPIVPKSPTSPIVPTSPLIGPMITRPISPDPSPRRYNRLEPFDPPIISEPKRPQSPLRSQPKRPQSPLRSEPSQPLRRPNRPPSPLRRPNNRIQYVPYKRMNERRRQVFYHDPVEILVLAAENNSYVLTNGQVSYCEDKNLSWRKHLLDDLKSFRSTKLYVLDPTSKKMYQDAQKTWREEEKWSSVKEIILCNTKRHLGKCSYCGEACLRFKAIVGGIMRIIPFELNMISH